MEQQNYSKALNTRILPQDPESSNVTFMTKVLLNDINKHRNLLDPLRLEQIKEAKLIFKSFENGVLEEANTIYIDVVSKNGIKAECYIKTTLKYGKENEVQDSNYSFWVLPLQPNDN